jgi:hypothetical protein
VLQTDALKPAGNAPCSCAVVRPVPPALIACPLVSMSQ